MEEERKLELFNKPFPELIELIDALELNQTVNLKKIEANDAIVREKDAEIAHFVESDKKWFERFDKLRNGAFELLEIVKTVKQKRKQGFPSEFSKRVIEAIDNISKYKMGEAIKDKSVHTVVIHGSEDNVMTDVEVR